jgi:hypothetical protein
MSTEAANDNRGLPRNFAQRKASNMWLRAKVVLEDEILLSELGFPNRSNVEKVIMVVTAGDRLHPTKGFDFLGADWSSINEPRRYHLLDQRDEAIEEIVAQVMQTLISRGFTAALEVAKTASPHQVVFLSDSQPDTEILIQRLLDMGLGTHELSDCDFGKRGECLYFRWDENLSYFLPGDYL